MKHYTLFLCITSLFTSSLFSSLFSSAFSSQRLVSSACKDTKRLASKGFTDTMTTGPIKAGACADYSPYSQYSISNASSQGFEDVETDENSCLKRISPFLLTDNPLDPVDLSFDNISICSDDVTIDEDSNVEKDFPLHLNATEHPCNLVHMPKKLFSMVTQHLAPTHFKLGTGELTLKHFSVHHYPAGYLYKKSPELCEILIDLSTIFNEIPKDVALASFTTDDSLVIKIKGTTTKKMIATEFSANIPGLFGARGLYDSSSLAEVSFALNLPGEKIDKELLAEIIVLNKKPYLLLHAPLCVKPTTITHKDYKESMDEQRLEWAKGLDGKFAAFFK